MQLHREIMVLKVLFPPQILSTPQCETIKNHKYKSGEYTPIDLKLNPIWLKLTDFLPLWMAPNLVTLIGWFHIILLWLTIMIYQPTPDAPTPAWVLFLASYCIILYQTMDAMDGKQARRTGSSSPLGQLFDHGCDCTTVFLIIHSVTVVLGLAGTRWQLATVAMGIFTFFIAQWQEFHLHVLPHAVGPFGVTEQQLIVSFFFFATALAGTGMWQSSGYGMSHVLALSQLGGMVATSAFSVSKVLKERSTAVTTASPLVHLVTPAMLCVIGVCWPSASMTASPLLVLLATAIPATHLCCKIIVFSMAKAPFAMVHLEAGPVALAWALDFFIGGSTISSVVLMLSISLSFAMFAPVWSACLCLPSGSNASR